jgi:hypothetical protein
MIDVSERMFGGETNASFSTSLCWIHLFDDSDTPMIIAQRDAEPVFLSAMALRRSEES